MTPRTVQSQKRFVSVLVRVLVRMLIKLGEWVDDGKIVKLWGLLTREFLYS